MPTFEFFGHSQENTQQLISQIKLRLAKVEFCNAIVFVVSSDERKVIDWNRKEQPFIRIYSRSTERLKVLVESLNDLSDIETVLIGFYEKAT